MGFLDDGFLGGMFDLNGDGKVDIGEEFMAYKMYEDVTGDEEDDDDYADDEDDDLTWYS